MVFYRVRILDVLFGETTMTDNNKADLEKKVDDHGRVYYEAGDEMTPEEFHEASMEILEEITGEEIEE